MNKIVKNLIFYAKSTGDIVWIDTVSITQIGAVCEFDGSSAGSKVWGDKSGNDLHGTVSGATLENTPYDSGTEYEEGTWTPVIYEEDSGTTISTSTANGSYLRIGNLVHIEVYLAINANGSGSEWISVDLPYSYRAGSGFNFPVKFSGVDVNGSDTVIGTTWTSSSSNRLMFLANVRNASQNQVQADDIASGDVIGFSGTYRV